MSKVKLEKEPSNNEGGILTRLWRDMLETKRQTFRLDNLIGNYLRDNVDISNRSNTIKRLTKSQLSNIITAPELTFKSFWYLTTEVLKAIKFTMTIKLTFANGDETYHTIEVNNNSNMSESFVDAIENETDNTKPKKTIVLVDEQGEILKTMYYDEVPKKLILTVDADGNILKDTARYSLEYKPKEEEDGKVSKGVS